MEKFNLSVSVLRVFSLFLVVFAHVCSCFGVETYQIASVGVSSFLLLSGYLYGERVIAEKKHWFFSRVKKILFPFWILSFFLSVYLVLKGQFMLAFLQFFETMIDLQGISFLVLYPFCLGNYHLSGLSHCWFLTIIFLCYLMVCFVKESRVEKYIMSRPLSCLFIILIFQCMFAFLNVLLGYFVVFFFGYFLAKKKLNDTNVSLLVVVVLSVISVAIRILLKKHMDGSILYNNFVAPFSSNVCAVCCFYVSKRMVTVATWLNEKNVLKFWKIIDKQTYSIYLTHYMFLTAPFCVKEIFPSGLQLLMFFLLTIVSACVLNFVSEKICVWNH